MLLTDFDASRQAVINPDMLFSPVPDLPETVVSCFSHVTFERMLDMAADVRVLAELGDANAKYPIYRGLWQGTPLTFALAMVGAPSCVAMLEELHALGAKRFVVFGNCGVLNQQIRDCGIIIPTAAVRDEGTSFHYAPPSDEIPANPKYRGAFEAILRETGVDFTEGKVWTTDAFYRETRAKFEKRKAQGCVCVDMECSALMALARARVQEFDAAAVVEAVPDAVAACPDDLRLARGAAAFVQSASARIAPERLARMIERLPDSRGGAYLRDELAWMIL